MQHTSNWRSSLAWCLSVLLVLSSLATGALSATHASGYFGVSPIFVWALCTCIAIPALAGLLGAWWRVVLLSALLVPLTLVEALLAWRYHARLSPHTVNVMLSTDWSEASAYLGQVLGWLLAGSSIGCSGVWAAWKLRAPALPAQLRLKLLVAAGAMAAALMLVCELGFENRANTTGLHVQRISWQLLEQTYPWGLPLRAVTLWEHRKDQRALLEQTKHFRFGATYTGTEKRTVVLVIGESSRRHNWQLGGYARETNPRLMKRADVLWLGDYTAPAVSTAMSVPLMLTRQSVGYTDPWHERSIVAAFREAGYGTWWLSTQQTAGIHDLQIASYAQEAEHIVWANVTEFQSRGADDMALLAPFRAALASANPQKFIVVHTMGSHFKYHERYPPEAAYLHGATGDQAEIDAYDNSIRFTDAVLDALIGELDATGEPAVLIYAADHGQLIAGDATDGVACDKRWHGHGSEWDVQAAALAWSHGMELGQLSRDAKISGAGLFATLAELGQLRIPGEALERSWLRGSATIRVVDVLGKIRDVDAKLSGACRLLRN